MRAVECLWVGAGASSVRLQIVNAAQAASATLLAHVWRQGAALDDCWGPPCLISMPAHGHLVLNQP